MTMTLANDIVDEEDWCLPCDDYDWVDFKSGMVHRLILRADGKVLFLSDGPVVVSSGWHGSWIRFPPRNKVLTFGYKGGDDLITISIRHTPGRWNNQIMVGYFKNRPCAALNWRGVLLWDMVGRRWL